jgi:hypothetical protein
MSEEDRVRRTVILCRHCLRNIAFFRAGWRVGSGSTRVRRQFWIAANGAFMDCAILDWCKLFADPGGKHLWSKTVADKNGFAAALYSRLRLTESEFSAYVKTFKHPRDKFIAHLDVEDVMYLPQLRVARASAAFLYDYLLNDASTAHWFRHDGNPSAQDFYKACYEHAISEYRSYRSAMAPDRSAAGSRRWRSSTCQCMSHRTT